MNISHFNKFALCGAIALMLTACESGQMHPYGKRANNNNNSNNKLGPQKIDECPAAEGMWSLAGGTKLELGRYEGFLELDHPDLSEPVVFDGQMRKITNKDGVSPEVTATCSGKTMFITYKYDGKTVKQSWNVDLEKDIISYSEKEGDQRKTVLGSRVFDKPASNPPEVVAPEIKDRPEKI